jgi:replication factor A1
MSLEEILIELKNQTNVSKDELIEKINRKCGELSGLITQEAAAYLIAKELGVDLPGKDRKQLQVKNIVPGMKNVNVVGRIFKISPINEFKRRNGKKGRVVNLFIGDSTGFFRLPLWNDQVKLVEEETLKLEDMVQIANGMAKENVFGDTEISLGRFGRIAQVDTELPQAEELTKRFLFFTPEKTSIKDLVPGTFEVRGMIVHVFKTNFLFDVCSVCGGKLVENKCEEHGEVDSNKALVISSIIDDSTDTIRAVFFRDVAERLITTQVGKLTKLTPEKRYELIKEKLMGKELMLIGRVKKNKRYNKLELIVNDFKLLNILEESKKLADELELKVG